MSMTTPIVQTSMSAARGPRVDRRRQQLQRASGSAATNRRLVQRDAAQRCIIKRTIAHQVAQHQGRCL